MEKQNAANVTYNKKATSTAEDEFIYGGYHFTPYGLFSEKENSDFRSEEHTSELQSQR